MKDCNLHERQRGGDAGGGGGGWRGIPVGLMVEYEGLRFGLKDGHHRTKPA